MNKIYFFKKYNCIYYQDSFIQKIIGEETSYLYENSKIGNSINYNFSNNFRNILQENFFEMPFSDNNFIQMIKENRIYISNIFYNNFYKYKILY